MRLQILAVAAALAIVAPAAAAPATASVAAAKVTIGNFTFGPAALVVKAGTTVTFVNGDDIPHTVVAADKKTFRSKVLDTGESFTFTFTRPGAYDYFCSIHPHMTGRVVVKPA